MFSYQKLKTLQQQQEEDADVDLPPARPRSILTIGGRGGRWGRRRWSWRRPKLRVAALLRRVVSRKAAAVSTAVRVSLEKVVKRMKEGRPYVGDLFAGNYLFMQVNPSAAMPYFDKYRLPQTSKLLQIPRHHHHHSPAAAPKISSS